MEREFETADTDVVELGIASRETQGGDEGQGESLAKRQTGISND